MSAACTPENLAAVVARFGGLSSGSHSVDSGFCCVLEAVSVCDDVPWTDSPDKLDRPDIRPLNDADWSSDALRTEQMLRLAPLLAAWPQWNEPRRLAYAGRVTFRTITDPGMLPAALRAARLEEHAVACEQAKTLEAAARTAVKATAVAANSAMPAWAAMLAVWAAWASKVAAEAAWTARAAAEAAGAADRILTRAVTIWAEEALVQ